jgi:hypothetical protein
MVCIAILDCIYAKCLLLITPLVTRGCHGFHIHFSVNRMFRFSLAFEQSPDYGGATARNPQRNKTDKAAL